MQNKQNRKYRYFPVLMTGAVLTSFLSGCSFNIPFLSKDEDDGSAKDFNLVLESPPQNLDPQTASDTASRTIIANIFEGLMKINEAGETGLGCASDYEISSDGLEYRFTLREDAKWFFDKDDDEYMDDDEYTPMTANDFVFAFRRIFDPDTESPYAEMFSMIENSTSKDASSFGVSAPDDKTVVFRLKESDPEFLTLLTNTGAMPCNEEFFYSTKGRYGLDERSINSNGPFFIQQWFYDEYGTDNFIYIHRNLDYSKDDTVYPKRVNIRIKNSDDDSQELFKNGESDLLITDEYYNRYFTDDDYRVEDIKYASVGLIFNTEDQYFKNEDMRLAVRTGIDINAAADEMTAETTVGCGVVPPAVKVLGRSYRELSADESLAVDYQKEEAGELAQKVRKKLGIKSFDSAKLLVCSDAINCNYLHTMIDQWKDNLGLYVSLDEVSRDEFDKRVENKNYSFALCDISSEENLPSYYFSQFVDKDNLFGISSAEARTLYSKIKEEKNMNSCIDIYSDLEREIINTTLYYPLFYKSVFLVTNSKVRDFNYDPYSGQLRLQYAKKFR